MKGEKRKEGADGAFYYLHTEKAQRLPQARRLVNRSEGEGRKRGKLRSLTPRELPITCLPTQNRKEEEGRNFDELFFFACASDADIAKGGEKRTSLSKPACSGHEGRFALLKRTGADLFDRSLQSPRKKRKKKRTGFPGAIAIA